MPSTQTKIASELPGAFYLRCNDSMPRTLIEIGLSAAPPQGFVSEFLRSGWRAWLIEQNAAMFAHIASQWKEFSNVECLLQQSQPLHQLLREARTPSDVGLVILNDSQKAVSELQDLLVNSCHPSVYAISDQNGAAAERSPAYELLIRHGYRFAGVEQPFSLWTKTDFPGSLQNAQRVELPRVLEEEVDHTCFDTPTSDERYAAVGHLDIAVGGWAFIDTTETAPASVFIELTDLFSGAVEYAPATRYPRLDVSRHFGQPELLMSGFHAVISMRTLHPHGMRLRVIQVVGNKCFPSKRHLVIERGLKVYEENARQGLAQKYLRGSGIEIGALQRKLELPPTCKVRYVDRMAMSDLLHHYPELKGMPLQAPDIVDDGEQLNHVSAGALDFVVANHFFEHCENPIQTLQNLLRVLKPNGLLFMAVPDKRYTFDVQRPSTAYKTLLETYHSGTRADRGDLYKEWARFIERHGDSGLEERAKTLLDSKYSIHFNVWTADELLTFFVRVREDLAMPFQISAAVCSDNECICLLEKVLQS